MQVAAAAMIPPVEHHCELIEGFSVAGMWTGVCSCGRITGDGTREDAEREAREHEADPAPKKLEPWQPGKRPMPVRKR